MTHPFIEHLKKDHEKQRSIGEQLRNAQTPEEREKLRKQMYEALYPHIEGEDASLFDYMKSEEGKAREGAFKAMQEHHVAKMVLNELMDVSLDGETLHAKAYVLDELNRHHMDEEEKTHFPRLQSMASEQQLDELFEQYEQAEKKAKKSSK